MRKITVLALIILIVLMTGVVSFAVETTTETYSTTTVDANTATSTTQNNTLKSGDIPNVTIEQASSWVEKKGYEVVKFLQTIVQPFAVIIFIICAFFALIGAFGNSQLVGKGLFGMFIAVFMYIVILFSPEILDFILNWVKT